MEIPYNITVLSFKIEDDVYEWDEELERYLKVYDEPGVPKGVRRYIEPKQLFEMTASLNIKFAKIQ